MLRVSLHALYRLAPAHAARPFATSVATSVSRALARRAVVVLGEVNDLTHDVDDSPASLADCRGIPNTAADGKA